MNVLIVIPDGAGPDLDRLRALVGNTEMAMSIMPPNEEGRLDDEYVRSLAADLYWAEESWLRRVDPEHWHRPVWRAFRRELQVPYLLVAKASIDNARERERTR